MAHTEATPPRRRRRRRRLLPLIVLLVVAAIPAFGLWTLFSWSDARVEEDAENSVPPPPTTVVAPPPASDPLLNPFTTYRRMPTIISRDVSIEDFEAALVPFFGLLNERSCAAVSVDGIDVGAVGADRLVIPASNQKLLVAAVALEVLGPDYRYHTDVAVGTGPVDGVLDGDLYLIGGGDPLLSSDWYPTSNLDVFAVINPTSFDELADQVVAAGITRIEGDVIGDGTRYDDEYYAPGWGLGEAGLEAGPYDALMANDSRVFDDDLRAGDPVRAAAREFIILLEQRGVEVAGEPVNGQAPANTERIGRVRSAPMTAVVEEMLQTSDNNTAELLVKEIGYADPEPGTRPAGLRVMRQTLGQWGVDVDGLVLTDGSGLSEDNLLTCRAVLDVLQLHDVDGPIGSVLPVLGESGTLRSVVLTDEVLAGRLRGKTGTQDNPPFNEDPPAVKALSGYLPIDGGGAIEYSLILNGPTISDQSEYRPIWHAFAEALATYPSGPSPAEIGLLP